MNRLDQLFQGISKDLLNIYFTAGHPNLNDTVPIIEALSKHGVDMIEIGMPYSDPLADGPTIQESGQLALKNGMKLPLLFEQLAGIRKVTQVPLILMGYFNQVMQYGEEAFLKKCFEIGIDGLILPDLPLSIYESEYLELFKKYQLKFIFLITPQTPDDRIRKIDSLSNSFIYMVSSAATTGKQKDVSQAQLDYFERIERMQLKSPLMIGFGIHDKKSFHDACTYASGAIIGSAFIKALSKAESIDGTCQRFINSIKPF